MLKNFENIGVVILAAGKGTRLGCSDKPKVMLEIGGKPIVEHTVDMLYSVGFTKPQICLVVGFMASSVKKHFKNRACYATQTEQIGTGHAAFVGMRSFPKNISNVLVLGGDDSAFYTPETIKDFVYKHISSNHAVSVLSVKKDNPANLGRMIRDKEGCLVSIKEKEQLLEEENDIDEINTGTYCFDKEWYQDAFLRMPIIEKLGEYGLNTSILMAREDGKGVQAVCIEDGGEWFGVNTPGELEEANKIKLGTQTSQTVSS